MRAFYFYMDSEANEGALPGSTQFYPPLPTAPKVGGYQDNVKTPMGSIKSEGAVGTVITNVPPTYHVM